MERVCSGSARGLATGRRSVPGTRLLHGRTTLCYSDGAGARGAHSAEAPCLRVRRSCMLSAAPYIALARTGGVGGGADASAWAVGSNAVHGFTCCRPTNPHPSLRYAALSAVSACDGRGAPRGRRCWWTTTRPSTRATGPTTPAWALTRAIASSGRCPRARNMTQRCAFAAAMYRIGGSAGGPCAAGFMG